MLTPQQRQLYGIIQESLAEKGVAPSIREMMAAMQLHSLQGVHRMVGELEEKGFIRRLPARARAIEIIRLPEDQVDVVINGSRRIAELEAEVADLRRRLADALPCPPEEIAA